MPLLDADTPALEPARPAHANSAMYVRMSDDRRDLLYLDLPRAEAIRRHFHAHAVEAGACAPRRWATRRGSRSPCATATSCACASVCDLAWIAGRAENHVGHHLRALCTAGLAASRSEGKIVFYTHTGAGRKLVNARVPVEQPVR